ncbi:hypothetical protein AVEN_273022-1 [Araneus ventricosus]|uniref:ribonuclease H n=1 Tax=Araneus ventricosus TaxID=182803 RepID=A0A4Y2EZ29_ARAVE|nr:hypothetical protein AVEN_273022-1 [Araneus ventricosus]
MFSLNSKTINRILLYNSLVLLTSRFEATRGLFWYRPRHFELRSDDEDDAWSDTLPNIRTTPTNTIKRLHTIRRVFLIKLLRPYRTTATQALNVLSGIPPSHIRAKMEYLRFQMWTCRSRGLDGIIDLLKLDKFEKLSEIPLNTRILELRDKVQDSHFEVYTDGSKVDGGVGFSVCILHGEIQHKIICKKLEPQNTVFQAELAALGEAVDWAIENKKKINIYTDSRSSIEALKSYGSISKFLISIKNKFCLAEGLVGLAWVKAHVGIPGNELADHFAKLASVEGEAVDIPFPYSFVKFALKKKLLKDRQIHYGAYETASGNRIRGFVPYVDTNTLIKSKYLIYFLRDMGHIPAASADSKFYLPHFANAGHLEILTIIFFTV